MQKFMRKRGILIVLLLISILLLITSCTKVPGGGSPRETDALLKEVQSGTQGVTIVPLANYPPPILYDNSELVSIVEIQNRGNRDLEPSDCFIQITGFDPNIIRGGFGIPRSCSENSGNLEGKTVYNTQGGINQIEFDAPSVQLPNGVNEYSPTLNYVTCYNYETKANPLVCVDPLFFEVSAQQKTCQPRNVGLAGGQGAPVAVTNINVDMVGKNRAIFEITLSNVGGGQVLSPSTGIQNCGQGILTRDDLNSINYDVSVAGQGPVDCKPRDRTAKLYNNQAKIICTFNIPGTVAYTTPLQITLQYSYMQSQTKPIRIVATPQ